MRNLLQKEEDLEIVGEAGDGEEAIRLAERLSPDVAVMDIVMPKLSGIEATRRIKEVSPSTAVLILTAYEDDRYIIGLLEAGAAGYLLKSEPPERIVEFLHGVAGGEAALSGAVARRLLERVREGGRLGGGVPDEIASRLSAREVEVLLLLDEHLTTEEIAARLFISEHTVRSHVKSLLRKLGVSSRREALERLELARS